MLNPLVSLTKRVFRHLGYDVVANNVTPGRKQPEKYIYQTQLVHFEINPGDKVLDIGSGGQPFPLATHLCDMRLEVNPDRPTDPIVIDYRPFIISDIKRLPFITGEFDFVYCCHVLEHVDDPIACCEEIQRIAKKGYIETPTLAKDALFGWAKGLHKWHITNHENTLLFFEYTERLLEGCRSSYWKNRILGSSHHPLQDLYLDNLDIFNVMFLWKEKFRVEVYRNGYLSPEVFNPD